ncbi:hypothetical protein [Bacillus massiliigorillae]|uniref:hypothetical protein n=1 Tax=Bacillus massiliigorillae TaxID=1243664 RepID=UPI0005A60941|nr:hypothetical protein [Bacillus massiliigorillae]
MNKRERKILLNWKKELELEKEGTIARIKALESKSKAYTLKCKCIDKAIDQNSELKKESDKFREFMNYKELEAQIVETFKDLVRLTDDTKDELKYLNAMISHIALITDNN